MPSWPTWLWWLPALAGLVLLAVAARRFARYAQACGSHGVSASFLVVVHDREDAVEGVVRELVARHRWRESGGPGPEMVVVDDGSTDDTSAILVRLAGHYPGFVRIVRVEAGACAIDRGLEACCGRTVVVLDFDGLAGPDPRRLRPDFHKDISYR